MPKVQAVNCIINRKDETVSLTMSVVQLDLVDGVGSVLEIYSHTLNNVISRMVTQARYGPWLIRWSECKVD